MIFDKILGLIKTADEQINAIPKLLDIPEDEKQEQVKVDDSDAITTETLRRIVNLVSSDNNENNEQISQRPTIYDELNKIFNDVAIPNERIKYYQQIEEVYKAFPISRRILFQYITSVCKVDPITGKIIIQRDNKDFNENSDVIISNKEVFKDIVRNFQNYIIAYYDLEDRLKNRILPKVFLFGNYYVEIIDKNKFLKLDDLLQEDTEEIIQKKKEKIKFVNRAASRLLEESITKDNIDEHLSLLNHITDVVVESSIIPEIESEYSIARRNSYLTLLESSNQDKQHTIENKITQTYKNISREKLQSIDLLYHNPHNVLIIHDQQKIYGYLVIQPEDNNNTISTDITKYLNQLFNQSQYSDKSLQQVSKELFDKFIKFIVNKIYKQFENELEKLPTDEEKKKALLQSLYKIDKQLFTIVRDIYSTEKLKKIRVRYIPADRMVNFYTDVQEWPYGQSVIEPLIFYSKLYLLTLLSNVITKLSRASVIRKWILDVGITQQHGNLVQKLKRELTNKIITIDSIGSLQAIPRILTDYKDLITLQKNGKSFVDFVVQQTGDPSVEIQDLDFLKAEMVSLSKVPSPYLGQVDTVELREQLVTANIIWAETISSYQQVIADKLNELIDKIYLVINRKIINNDEELKKNLLLPSDVIKLGLNQPVMLQLQYIDAIFASISNTLQILTSTPEGQKVDIVKFLKKFIPTIDWDEFIMSDEDYKRRELDALTQSQNQQNTNQQPF